MQGVGSVKATGAQHRGVKQEATRTRMVCELSSGSYFLSLLRARANCLQLANEKSQKLQSKTCTVHTVKGMAQSRAPMPIPIASWQGARGQNTKRKACTLLEGLQLARLI